MTGVLCIVAAGVANISIQAHLDLTSLGLVNEAILGQVSELVMSIKARFFCLSACVLDCILPLPALA